MGYKKKLKKQHGLVAEKHEKIWAKLEYAFALGCTDREACAYAEISAPTLYKIMENKNLYERRLMLKAKPLFAARKAVVEALPDNPELALKFLERKLKKEFSLRPQEEASPNINVGVIALPQRQGALDGPESLPEIELTQQAEI